MQTVLEEIAESRPLPSGITPQRFLNARYFRGLNQNGFVDSLYRSH
jgi:hypothetical protein